MLDADILDDGIWHAHPTKLIRRSLIEHLSLRFCDDMVQGEDQVFMASASSLLARSASWAAGTSITGACCSTTATCRGNGRRFATSS